MKKMLKFLVLPALMLSLVGLGNNTNVSTTSNIEILDVVETKREATGDTGDLYLVLGDTWGSGDADYYIHMWGGATTDDTAWPGTKFVASTGNASNQLVIEDASLSNTNIIISRYKTGSTSFPGSIGGDYWNRWDYYDSNAIDLKKFNMFVNNEWSNCETRTTLSSTVDIYAEVPATFDGTVSMHAWAMTTGSLGGLSTAWPGETMTEVTENIYETDGRIMRFTGDLNFTPTDIIISEKTGTTTQQSKDIDITSVSTFVEVLSTSTGTGDNKKFNASEFDDATARIESLNFLTLFRAITRTADTNDICWVLADEVVLNPLLNSYSKLSGDIKVIVDGMLDYTPDGLDPVTIGQTMTVLVGNAPTSTGSNLFTPIIDSMIIPVAIIAFSLLAAGVFLVLNKKRAKR